MLKHNFLYELKQLISSKWIFVLLLLLLSVFLFAGYNGKQAVTHRLEDIKKAEAKVAKSDKQVIQLLDSIEQGHQVSIRRSPKDPMSIGYGHPRVAAFYPEPLTFVAIGQSDMFTHFVKPRVYGDSFQENYSAMTNPVQLLFGSFDISFVIIYILPLIIIAFSYNVLSGEKEAGTLKLLASQPISVYKWLFQKISFRFFWFTVISIGVLAIAFAVNGFDFSTNFSAFLSLALITTCYMLFWFAVALLINVLVGSSAKNAVSLLGVWVLITLIIPAVVSQLGNALYPIPSRTKMLNEARVIKDEAAKKQDKILDNFLRDHPEYAAKEGTVNYSFWHRYIASQDVIEEDMQPLIDTYESKLQKQQDWIQNWQYASPAILMQQSMNNLAATSTVHYQSYKKQVVDFTKEWKAYFIPLLYANKEFESAMFKDLPKFNYQLPKVATFGAKLLVLLIFSSVILMIAWLSFKKKTQQKGLFAS